MFWFLDYNSRTFLSLMFGLVHDQITYVITKGVYANLVGCMPQIVEFMMSICHGGYVVEM